MDKTAWFVVTLCVGLLALNYWSQKDQPTAAASAVPAAQTAPAVVAAQPTEPAEPATVIHSLTSYDKAGKPVARYHFQDVGGSLRNVEMLGKAINSTRPELSQDVSLNGTAAQGIGTLMFGLSAEHAPQYDTARYRVIPAETNDTKVTLVAQVGDLIVRKIYTLAPLKVTKDGEEKIVDGHSYVLNLRIDVQNSSDKALAAENWGVYAGGMSPISKGEGSYYTHYVTLEDGDFNKESPGSFRPLIFGSDKDRIYSTGLDNLTWGGTMNQYYSIIMRPVEGTGNNAFYAAPVKYTLPVTGDQAEGVELGMGVASFTLSPKTETMQGGVRSLSFDIFAGPKLNLMLSDMTDEFRMIDRVMDYGWLYILSYPMNWLINVFHGWFGNWGWAIVAMTFVVRLLIWPLYRKSYKSMKSMSLLQPKMQELKAKYPNDQQKVSMEMMKLYREYGISPMGGCLPMFLQIPIFFAFFYVLQTAAEFRGAPFIGWVTDLSQCDTVCTLPIFGWDLPINILPIVMAVSMVVQMHMTPQAGDPMQQRIMKFMPVMFFLFCYTYPSALALYWTTTNIISIIQTLIIRRMPAPELQKQTAKKKGGKKGFFERMMAAQQAALAEQQRQAQMRNVTRK